MKTAPIPPNEQERLAALRAYEILDTEPDAALDGMLQLAAYICQTPIATISLIDENRQWFKSKLGLDASETTREAAFCAHTILQEDMMVVPNAAEDERFFDNPSVTALNGVRFYAGVPLASPNGLRIGALCVVDRVVRALNPTQLEALHVLAKNVMAHLELRLSHKRTLQYANDLQLAATIFDAASEAMMVTDADNRILTINPAFTHITGYTLAEVIGKDPKLLRADRHDAGFYQAMWQSLATTHHWQGEVWGRHKNGDEYIEQLSINVILNADGSTRLYVAIFSDITEKKKADALIWRQANYDHLTQLPNRSLFRDRLAQEIKLAHRAKHYLALFFIDLDDFKKVNDTLGHAAGDEVLAQAAQRITQSVREADTVARMGGDEFTVILSQIDDINSVHAVAEMMIAKLSAPFMVDDAPVTISASIGIAFFPTHGESADVLLQLADKAMYAAKAKGRSQYAVMPQG